jgi:hypothetical protein
LTDLLRRSSNKCAASIGGANRLEDKEGFKQLLLIVEQLQIRFARAQGSELPEVPKKASILQVTFTWKKTGEDFCLK